jgi:hypothetical protein
MDQSDNPLAAVVAHGHSLAEAIVDTVLPGALVEHRDLRVIAASRSFYRTFAAELENTQGRMLYELGVVDALARQLDATVQKSSGP